MKTVVPTTLDIAREAGWSGENEPKDFVGALNVLADHIGTASPEAVAEIVDDWLDNHPEALVANGSVTTEKLADGAVTEEKLGVDLGDAPERVAELLGNQLTGSMSGTIDTASDAYAAPPMALTVEGASVQDTTTGKNLLPNDRFCKSTYNPPEGTAFDPSLTPSGTITDNDDGTFTMTAASGWAGLSFYTDVLQAGSYYLHVGFSGSTPRISIGVVRESDLTFIGTAYVETSAVTVNRAYTLTEPSRIVIYVASSSAGTVTITQPQLEAGSTSTPYEPYTGGKASPNPDYPQPILSVDECELNVTGKNLFDPSHLLEASGWTVSNGVYTGTVSALYNKYFNPPYHVGGLSGTSQAYTVSLDYNPTDSSQITYIVFAYTDSTIEYTNRMIQGGHYSFTSRSEKVLMGIAFSYSSNQIISLSNIQIELGPTATAYEPYQGQTIPDLLPEGTDLRSLPDGTKDTLSLSYLRPSTRAGWAWYSRELVRNVVAVDLGTLEWVKESNNRVFYMRLYNALYAENSVLCSQFSSSPIPSQQAMPDNSIGMTNGQARCLLTVKSAYYFDTMDAAQFKAAMNGVVAYYHLLNTTTETLDPIELPVLPAPTATVWCDGGSATPSFVMKYVKDTNIVIANMQAMLDDLATS